MTIYDYIDTLVNYGIEQELIYDTDDIYIRNRILAFLKINDYQKGIIYHMDLENIIAGFTSYALENKLCEDLGSDIERFETELMSILVDRPSNIIDNFYDLYFKNKEEATKYFYNISTKSNYVKEYRIKKDIKWKYESKYGLIDMSINLSKPEKDPRDIAKALKEKSTNYPQCNLCKENEGYIGGNGKPNRGNIRLIPLILAGEKFYFQYSPYAYYNEHAIILNDEHKPMVIDRKAFEKLLDFIDFMPHYFIGSNADLPIVGGSILSHEHFQGGRYRFAMNDAKSIFDFEIKGYDAKFELLHWPLSVIRVKSKNKEELIDIADFILKEWINYSDPELNIYAYTDGVRHNTITPIALFENGEYVLNLVLRNNLTTKQYPLGLFHPHPEYHNIKRENIGLIEVMGLAILPQRLKKEFESIRDYVIDNKPMNPETYQLHKDFISKILMKNPTKSNINDIIYHMVGEIFEKILENCGVFKQNEEGIEGFKKFVSILKVKYDK